MLGEERQHVVEKRDSRFDTRLPAPVNDQPDEYGGLVGHALHLSVPLFHACRLNSPFGGTQTENTRMRMKWAPPGARTDCISPFTDSMLPDNVPRQWPPRSPSPPLSQIGGKPGRNNRPPQTRQARWFACRAWER